MARMIHEADVIRLAERKQYALMYQQLANRMLDVCSDDAAPKWEEMLEDAHEELAKIAAQEQREICPDLTNLGPDGSVE